jgi:DNA-binding response OmpR family regulator
LLKQLRESMKYVEPTPSPAPAPWREALEAPPIHSPPRILLAEDDDAMRNLVAEALRKDGYEVLAVSDGGRLLVSLAHDRVDGDQGFVDLVVTDVRMPICSGMQILEQVRAARWRMPFILMTAFGDAATREQATNLGALLFDKPFELDDLRTAVASLLRRSA